MKFYEIKPQNTLFIGDSDIDIKTAKNANIVSGGVLWGNGSEKELETALADLLFKIPLNFVSYYQSLCNNLSIATVYYCLSSSHCYMKNNT